MVYTVYHPEKLQTIDKLIPQAKSLSRGQTQKTRRQATGRDSQGPKGITTQIMFKVILTLMTSKNAWEKNILTEPVRSGPRVDDSFKEASPDSLWTALQNIDKARPTLRAQNTLIDTKDLQLGIDERWPGIYSRAH